MVLELSDTTWKVLFRTAAGKQRNCSVKARDVDRLLAQISEARQRLGLAREACVLSCYEAGRDGFWLHRKLEASGVDNLIVDSSSIEVPRRARHRKTDRLDLAKLMEMLLRWARGEAKVWSVVHVPSMAEEDLRQLSRAIGRMKSERLQHRARIKSLLATQGIKVMAVGGEMWVKRVLGMGMWNGAPLGEHLAEDLILEGQRLSLIEQHLTKLKLKRDELMATSQQPAAV
jgi:transposase